MNLLHSHCRVYLKEVMEAETHLSREGGLDSESQRPARDGRRQMREREERVRDERKRREKGAETGIRRWFRRAGCQCTNSRGARGAQRGVVTEAGMQQRGGRREGPEGRPGGSRTERGVGRTGGCQGSFHDGSDTRRSPAPGSLP